MWNYFEPEEGRWYGWNLNGAAVWLRRDGDEWRTAYRPVLFQKMEAGVEGPCPAPPPEGLPCRVTAGTGRAAALRPSFGDKPCLLTFRETLRLLPDTEIHLDLALPPALQLEAAVNTSLVRFMPFLLSDAWYGDDTMSGTLCLSLPLSREARRESSPALIQGRMVLQNVAKTALDLSRLLLDTGLLSVYRQDGRLACETVVMEALGDGEFRTSLPSLAPQGGERLSGEKKNGGNGLLNRRGINRGTFRLS